MHDNNNNNALPITHFLTLSNISPLMFLPTDWSTHRSMRPFHQIRWLQTPPMESNRASVQNHFPVSPAR